MSLNSNSNLYLQVGFDRLFIQQVQMPRADEKLQTIQQLYNYPGTIAKACTVGFIIDATNGYFDQKQLKFVKKIKLIDDQFNASHFNPHQKFTYMTVFFFAPKLQDLPNPRFIGDIVYLRRFSFGRYNDNFQGHYIDAQYCSWALIDGNTNSPSVGQYQTSRSEMNLDDEEKYPDLSFRVGQLRRFSKKYLSQVSVLSVLPSGMKTKDSDYIVKVLKRTPEGIKMLVGKNQMVLKNVPSFAQQGSIAKLRSVLRIDKHDKSLLQVIPNVYTSLISLHEWTLDVQRIRIRDNQMQSQNEGEIFTTLAQLNALPLNECENRKYYVSVQVFKASAQEFSQAIKFYDEKKNALHDNKKKQTYPIYNFFFVCQDQSLTKQHKFSQIHLFSFDRSGSDFLERVKLEDLNEFSNYVEQSRYFTKRIEDILNSHRVKMTVQVLSDGKGNRLLRAIQVS